MLSIRKLSQLLGISPQTIRMYEQEGVFEAERIPSSHRRFGRRAITTLLKCRRLLSMGFGVKQVAEISGGVTFRDGQKMLRQRADELEEEIRLLMEKRRHVVNMYNQMRTVHRKQGSCEMAMAPARWCLPVLRNDELLIPDDAPWLDKWNECAFMRRDVKRVPKEALTEGAFALDYTGEYHVCIDDAERMGLDVSHAYRLEEQLCVLAYAVCPADEERPISEIFAFAADYIRENRLRITGELMFFLPFWMHRGDCEDYLMMAVPVERPEE